MILEKDLYVTEAIRRALQPLQPYPAVPLVFKGGTALCKGWQAVARFSEDIDIMAAPPPGVVFGSGKRKKTRHEVRSNLRAGFPFYVEEGRRGDFVSFNFVYSSTLEGVGPTRAFATVRIDLVTRTLNPDWIDARYVQSLAGEAATRIDDTLLEEYPFLRPFKVFAVHPMITLVEKLDALHGRSVSERPENIIRRARDVYDIACLLRHETISELISSDLIAALHAGVLDAQPPTLRRRDAERPKLGFGASPAFMAGHPACEALRSAYSGVLETVFSAADEIGFDDALEIIRSHADLL